MKPILLACVCAACLCTSAGVSSAQLGIGYATFLGGGQTDVCSGVATDAEGNVYVLGHSNSYEWLPGSMIYQPGARDSEEIFVAKYSASGERLWTTFIGGAGPDYPGAIAADSSGAYITGSADNIGDSFPTSGGAYQDHTNTNGAFIAKLNSVGGTLIYSTFIQHNRGDVNMRGGRGIAVADGFAYAAGTTYENSFPVTDGSSYGGGGDAFVLKLDLNGNALLWSTYLGGSGQEDAADIAVDGDGNAYVTGQTWSTDFPATTGAYMGGLTGAGTSDAFVTKLSDKGRIWSTYLASGAGSPYDTLNEYGSGIAVDAQGHAYAACTYGSLDLNEYDPSNVFVAKFARDGSGLNYLKCIRGSAEDVSGRLAVDASGCAYVTGRTSSADFDACTGLEESSRGSRQGVNPQEMEHPDAFVTKISSEGRCFEYSTLLGTGGTDWGNGIAVTSGGDAVVDGYTDSAAFPATIGADQEEYGGGYADGFLSNLFFLSSPGYCVRSSSLRVGDRFSVEARVNQNVEGPLDVFALVSTNPTGGERMLGSFMLNGEVREGIVALARNLPGIQAPLSHVLMPEITIRENFVGSHTFYVVTTEAGLVPPGDIEITADQLDEWIMEQIKKKNKEVCKTINFQRWAVDPPDLSGTHLPTAQEWDELGD